MAVSRQATNAAPLEQQANLREKLRVYWQLIKSLQTGLLLITGLAGFMSACCPLFAWPALLAMLGTLFLAISGSTILNMVYDKDIDARMKRTANRPLPSGQVDANEALLVGLMLAWLGVGGAFALSPLYGLVVFAGLFFDGVIYTMWLKRRTSWSIIWGGIAGGMPISLLQTGTPEEIRKHTKKAIETLGKEGGFVMACSTAIDRVSAEQLKAWVDAAKEFGVY